MSESEIRFGDRGREMQALRAEAEREAEEAKECRFHLRTV